MKIRKVEEKDIDCVWKIIKRNFNEVMIKNHSQEIVDKFKGHNNPKKLKEQMKWKDIYVVEEKEEIIGTGAIVNFGDEDSPRYSVSNFFVKPELHKQGIGEFIFEYLLEIAKEKNINKLHVPSSRSGFEFYKKMGFVKDEAQPDKEDEIIWMTMELD